MSRFMIGNLFLLLSMSCTTISHLMIKALVDEVAGAGWSWSWSALQSLGTAARITRGALAGTFLIAGFIFWLLCLTKLHLSYAYPIACSSVLLVALFSAVFLGEAVTARTWAGTVFILVGIVLLAPSN